MKCGIAKWDDSHKTKPVPEATPTESGHWEIEVDDVFAFAEKHNVRVQLIPPKATNNGQWFIYIVPSNRNFGQS